MSSFFKDCPAATYQQPYRDIFYPFDHPVVLHGGVHVIACNPRDKFQGSVLVTCTYGVTEYGGDGCVPHSCPSQEMVLIEK